VVHILQGGRNCRSLALHHALVACRARGAASSAPTLDLDRADQLGEDDAGLGLVFAFFVFVGDFTLFVGFEEQDLAEALVGVNLCGQRCGVADLEGDEAFPFGLERGDVDDDAAAGVGGFAEADREHVARNAEILYRARQRE
jgi:hypothetical protein